MPFLPPSQQHQSTEGKTHKSTTTICFVQSQNVQVGGFDANGQPMYVEVDETHYFHHKYHRGRHSHGTWVVGILEHGTGRCWLEAMARRNSTTLERIILDHVLPGTVS